MAHLRAYFCCLIVVSTSLCGCTDGDGDSDGVASDGTASDAGGQRDAGTALEVAVVPDACRLGYPDGFHTVTNGDGEAVSVEIRGGVLASFDGNACTDEVDVGWGHVLESGGGCLVNLNCGCPFSYSVGQSQEFYREHRDSYFGVTQPRRITRDSLASPEHRAFYAQCASEDLDLYYFAVPDGFECTPNCDAAVCGGDDCGGVCGTCGADEFCAQGAGERSCMQRTGGSGSGSSGGGGTAFDACGECLSECLDLNIPGCCSSSVSCLCYDACAPRSCPDGFSLCCGFDGACFCAEDDTPFACPY